LTFPQHLSGVVTLPCKILFLKIVHQTAAYVLI